jgi:outer membrane lipoprotein-sorting protein
MFTWRSNVKTLTTVLALSLALIAIPVLAADEPALPSADQILEKYVAASGGKEAIEKVTSRVTKGTIDVPTFGASGTFEQVAKAPNLQITTSEFVGYGAVIQCFDGKTAWASEPERGLRDVTGAELDRQKRTADLYGAVHMKEHYKKLTVKGKGKAGDHEAYIIEAEPAEGSAEKLYFDTQSGLLVRVDVPTQQNSTATVLFEDYKDVDGVKVPFTMKQDSPEISLVIKTQEVKHNVPVDDAKFAKPAKQ